MYTLLFIVAVDLYAGDGHNCSRFNRGARDYIEMYHDIPIIHVTQKLNDDLFTKVVSIHLTAFTYTRTVKAIIALSDYHWTMFFLLNISYK